MEPELVVPDLNGFQLKAYVSYKTPEITQTAFTAQALFNKVYADDVVAKYSKKEQITDHTQEDIEKAKNAALRTGADMFLSDKPYNVIVK